VAICDRGFNWIGKSCWVVNLKILNLYYLGCDLLLSFTKQEPKKTFGSCLVFIFLRMP